MDKGKHDKIHSARMQCNRQGDTGHGNPGNSKGLKNAQPL